MSVLEEPRSLVRAVRWSPSEWERICRRAGRAGIRPSSYIRAAALRQTPERIRSPRTGRTRFAERRSIERTIRFHPKEWEPIVRRAEVACLPPDRFVREVVVGYRLGSRVNANAIRQLARLGNLLNQLTRLAHTLRQVDPTGRLQSLLARIERLFDELL